MLDISLELKMKPGEAEQVNTLASCLRRCSTFRPLPWRIGTQMSSLHCRYQGSLSLKSWPPMNTVVSSVVNHPPCVRPTSFGTNQITDVCQAGYQAPEYS